MSCNPAKQNGTLRLIDYDTAHLLHWRNYFPNTYWVNFEQESMRDVRNMALIERPGIDQRVESIYPLLTVRRVGIPELNEQQNLSAVNRGIRYGEKEMRLTYSEYTVTYNLDIFAAERNTLDELSVELSDTFIRNPNVDVLTNDEERPYISTNIYYQSITDNSDLDGADDKLRVFRATIVYTADVLIIRKYRHLSILNPSVDFVKHM